MTVHMHNYFEKYRNQRKDMIMKRLGILGLKETGRREEGKIHYKCFREEDYINYQKER